MAAIFLEMCHKVTSQLAGHVGMMSALTSAFWQLLLIFHKVTSQVVAILDKMSLSKVTVGCHHGKLSHSDATIAHFVEKRPQIDVRLGHCFYDVTE